MIGVGLAGCGYWGANLLRSLVRTDGVEVRAVADRSPARLAAARELCPGARLVADADDVIADPTVDAVVVATDAASHAALAGAALAAGKHVLVAKPLAESSDDAARLVEAAERRRLVLMVDHTFVYTAAAAEIARALAAGELGETLFVDAVRTSLHRFHPACGVVRDLAVHDLALLDNLLGEAPEEISATGLAITPGGAPDVAHLTLRFGGRRLAHLHANWLTSVKLRRMTIGGGHATLVWDDLDPFEKVRVYSGGPLDARDEAAVAALRADYRAGGMRAPRLPVGEALRAVARELADCVNEGRRPRTDGESGLRVALWIEAAERSLARRGEPVRCA